MDCVAWQRCCHNMSMSCLSTTMATSVCPASCIVLRPSRLYSLFSSLSISHSLYQSTFTIRPVTSEHSFWLSCACQLAAKSVLFSTTLSHCLCTPSSLLSSPASPPPSPHQRHQLGKGRRSLLMAAAAGFVAVIVYYGLVIAAKEIRCTCSAPASAPARLAWPLNRPN